MKTKLLLSLLLSFSFCLLSSQVPQGFNYMAIARDAGGNILPNTNLEVRIAILSSLEPRIVVWEEKHDVITNETGLFQLTIGDPLAERVEGCLVNSFEEIEWTVKFLYVRTSIFLSGDWTVMGDARLFSVPYAMVAGSAYSGVGNPFVTSGDSILISKSVGIGTDNLHKATLAVMGDNALSEDPLFEVKRNDGQTMFAVYNQGVRINVPLIDNVKGPKGGFAIGGFSASKAGVQDLFSLNKDSVRFYIDKTPDLTKGAKGGFAIGGFEIAGKAPIQDYLSVTPDSTRIYIKEGAKGAKGGFAIGGFSGTKGITGNFLNLTKENYFIGHESGSIINGGLYNSVIGYQAGKNLTTGARNTILGYLAGYSTSNGNRNIIIGETAGYLLTTGNANTIMGYQAGYNHSDQEYNVMIGNAAGFHLNSPYWAGSFNTFLGTSAGYAIQTSRDNTFIGTNAGMFLDNGTGNTFIGTDAGRAGNDPGTWVPRAITANYNVFMGYRAGYHNLTGSNSVILGFEAGRNNQNGSGNVFLGNQAGYLETGSNKLYVTNSHKYDSHQPVSPTNPGPILIYGDLAANKLGINTYTLNKTLNVGGDAEVTGNLSAASVSAPVTGDVTGNVTGNLTGKVTGDVTGNVTGNLTGDVNGISAGKFILSEGGIILTTAAGDMELSWDYDNGRIILNNKMTYDIAYWWKSQKDNASDGMTGSVLKGEANSILSDVNYPLAGYEIHFGQADGPDGWCSVWLQFMNNRMVGHYLKY